jgi:hypothetical protein
VDHFDEEPSADDEPDPELAVAAPGDTSGLPAAAALTD